LDFIKQVSLLEQESFPIHLAKKFQKDLNRTLLKQEFFIFDMLSASKKSGLLFTPREDCFAPLKNNTGADSPTTCTESVMHYERKLFTHISKVPVLEEQPIELTGSFYYPTKEFLTSWHGKPLPPDGYAQ
jgi:UDP-N-acetylglucosamine/UDP-N-acetylgalactosamine diphosphorylase